MTKLILTILLTTLSFGYSDIKVTDVISVYDGDTFKINIADYPAVIGEKISIRINGIDTPEKRGKCKKEKILAIKAQNYTHQKLMNAKEIILKNPQRGKYFRIVADVYVDGHKLIDGLLEQGLGVRYGGGAKVKDWCK